VLKLSQHLRDLRDSGSAFQMPKMPFEGAHSQRIARLPVHVGERAPFGCVWQFGAEGLSLDVLKLRCRGPSASQHFAHERRLRARMGKVIGTGAALVRATGRENVAVDVVPVRSCERFGHQQHCARAFTGNEAVAAFGEGPRFGAGREHSSLTQRKILRRMQIQVDARYQRYLTVAAPQALRGQMQGDVGRRARSVHRKTRAHPTECVRDAIGEIVDGARDWRCARCWLTERQQAVRTRGDSQKNPNSTARELPSAVARVFQCRPHQL
jgi:hypothetical protein